MRAFTSFVSIAIAAWCGALLLGRDGVLMDVDSLAAMAVAAAAACFALYLRLNRSPQDQGFSCQIGDEVFSGRYAITGGQVHVTYNGKTASAPLGSARPIHVAERLLAAMKTQLAEPASGSLTAVE